MQTEDMGNYPSFKVRPARVRFSKGLPVDLKLKAHLPKVSGLGLRLGLWDSRSQNSNVRVWWLQSLELPDFLGSTCPEQATEVESLPLHHGILHPPSNKRSPNIMI